MRSKLFFFLVLLATSVMAQKISFQRIELEEDVLKKTIIKYIDSIKTIDTIFQKMGFVEVELLKYNNLNPQKSDLQYIYRISDQGFLHKYDIKSSYLPHSLIHTSLVN